MRTYATTAVYHSVMYCNLRCPDVRKITPLLEIALRYYSPPHHQGGPKKYCPPALATLATLS